MEKQNSKKQAPNEGPKSPRAPARIVGRDRLLERLVAARHGRCIVIRGPAGSGKTTLALAFRQMLQPLGFDVAWLTLSTADNDPTLCLENVIGCMQTLFPHAFRDARQLAASSGADALSLETTALAMARGVASLGQRDLVLVLDDLHTVDAPAVHEALQWLAEYAPSNLHLVLLSRSAVPLALARLRAQGNLLEITAGDLRFTPKETALFLSAEIGSVTNQDAQALHLLTDGWVTGLRLLALDWMRHARSNARQFGTLAGFARARVSEGRAFDSYFQREVLSLLTEAELRLLSHAALFTRFNAPLCAALDGRPDSVADIAAILARLESSNLFVVALASPGDELWYRLHPLLQETLHDRQAQPGPEELHRLHRAACQWFHDHGLVEEAITHAVEAGDSARAAALLEAGVDRLQLAGRQRQFVALLRLLPSEQIEASVGLRLWSARMQLLMRDLDGCAASIESLERDIPSSELRHRAALVRLRVSLAAQKDDIDEIIALRPLLEDLPPGASSFEIGNRNNLLSWIHMQCGQHEQARRLQLEAPPLLVDGVPLLGTTAGMLQGRCLVGLSYAMEGRITQAERVYRDVLFEAERAGSACDEAQLVASALLGEVLYEMNDVEGAIRLLEPRVDAMEQVSIPDSVLRVIGVLAYSHWVLGQEMESFAYLERLEDYAARRHLDRLSAYCLAGQVHRHLARGRFDAAEAILVRLESLHAAWAHTGQRIGAEIEMQARRARIRWLAAHGAVEKAVQHLPLAIAQCQAHGDLRAVARLELQGVAIDMRLGRGDSAFTRLLSALRIGHHLGLLRSVLDADPEVPRLLRDLDQASLDPVLSFYVERLLAASSRGKTLDPSASEQPLDLSLGGLSEREMGVLELVAQALPSKKIARTLGISYSTIKWHLRNIYAKLEVSSRDEAVARLRELQNRVKGAATLSERARPPGTAN